MGQTPSSNLAENVLEDTVDAIQYEFKKHANILSQIGSLTYEEFHKSLNELNELSKKCVDSNGKMTIFAVKKGSDTSFLWKATVRIACVKCDPTTNRIDSYKMLNIKQFLTVFSTFQSHLEVMVSCEEQHEERKRLKQLFDNVGVFTPSPDGPEFDGSYAGTNQRRDESDITECCICLDRKSDVILPCTHVYCSPCIEQWNSTNKKCPICQENLNSTDDSWVLSEIPQADEVNEKILSELSSLTKQSSDEY